ncbi:transglutaminase-like domain-containing protein [Nocardia asteroides]|uniref:transglutaminase-like domain-containing protein n=1 Tax=Nocardia asteroides TaxID=1824 RepID=UPI001E4A988F|nr:transglutaminase-like domain-containing protein [Nocardia asteroides]UGT61785.1 transglutaminase-like domain-containing protein [Nocardia asteroides]
MGPAATSGVLDETQRATVPEALTAVLAQHALPAPRDGDCEVVSAAVTAALREQGLPAR